MSQKLQTIDEKLSKKVTLQSKGLKRLWTASSFIERKKFQGCFFVFNKYCQKTNKRNSRFVCLLENTGSQIKRRTNREGYSKTSSEIYSNRNSFLSSRQNWNWVTWNWIMLRKSWTDPQVHEWEPNPRILSWNTWTSRWCQRLDREIAIKGVTYNICIDVNLEGYHNTSRVSPNTSF